MDENRGATHFAHPKGDEWQERSVHVHSRHFEQFLPAPTVELGRFIKHILHVCHAGGVPSADVAVESCLPERGLEIRHLARVPVRHRAVLAVDAKAVRVLLQAYFDGVTELVAAGRAKVIPSARIGRLRLRLRLVRKLATLGEVVLLADARGAARIPNGVRAGVDVALPVMRVGTGAPNGKVLVIYQAENYVL